MPSEPRKYAMMTDGATGSFDSLTDAIDVATTNARMGYYVGVYQLIKIVVPVNNKAVPYKPATLVKVEDAE